MLGMSKQCGTGALRAPVALLLAFTLLFFAGCSSKSSTSAVLADGEYDVPVVLEGGSGRATVQSPSHLVVAQGKMTATVVWSSSKYDLMLVDGVEYRPVNTEGNSTFEIPVASLDKPLKVQAETTAMSEPHLIDYTLRFDLDALPAESVQQKTGTKQVAQFHNANLGNGWQPVNSLELKYAKCFTVDYFDGGYKLACLSDGNRYLIVPQGASVPEGIDKDIVILQQPIDHVYLAASDTMCLIDALGEMHAIAVSGIAKENWRVPAAVEAMESGAIVYGGKYSAPDYDVLLTEKCRLSIQSTMINHSPSVREKFIELGIPVMIEQSSYEDDPLGRMEWIKLYGALFDKEELAESVFNEQVAQVQAIQGADTGKTVAYFYINSNGAAVVRRPGDYVTKMIKLAGGRYIFDKLGDDTDGSTVTLEMESFFAQAKDADIIVYNATIDSSVGSIADLVGKNQLLSKFKAVQSGDVWLAEQSEYQHMVSTGDIISDFNKAFSGSSEDLVYLRKMK